jgi:hypothetical protein
VVFAAGRAAEARSGVVVRWMAPSNRTASAGAAEAAARLAAEMAAAGEPVVSFGLHASEGPKLSGEGPFPPEPFEAAFRIAKAGGLVAI